MRCLIFVSIFFLCIAEAHADDAQCSNDKRVVSACYEVHGRLQVNANSRLYLRSFDSKRIYAIAYKSDAPDADFFISENVAELINPDVSVAGNFQICPFTPDVPGKMQIACMDSASNLVTGKR